jgi:hypothetical protein
MNTRRRVSSVLALASVAGCASIAGVDDYGTTAADTGIPFASSACAACASEPCLTEKAACEADPTCSAFAACAFRCPTNTVETTCLH